MLTADTIEISKQLHEIHDVLWWCALWLFIKIFT